MVSMAGDSLEKLAPLFEGWEEALVWSVLQGCMGRAWADSRRKCRKLGLAQNITALWNVFSLF